MKKLLYSLTLLFSLNLLSMNDFTDHLDLNYAPLQEKSTTAKFNLRHGFSGLSQFTQSLFVDSSNATTEDIRQKWRKQAAKEVEEAKQNQPAFFFRLFKFSYKELLNICLLNIAPSRIFFEFCFTHLPQFKLPSEDLEKIDYWLKKSNIKECKIISANHPSLRFSPAITLKLANSLLILTPFFLQFTPEEKDHILNHEIKHIIQDYSIILISNTKARRKFEKEADVFASTMNLECARGGVTALKKASIHFNLNEDKYHPNISKRYTYARKIFQEMSEAQNIERRHEEAKMLHTMSIFE